VNTHEVHNCPALPIRTKSIAGRARKECTEWVEQRKSEREPVATRPQGPPQLLPHNTQGRRAHNRNPICEHLHRLNRKASVTVADVESIKTLNATRPAPERRRSIQILCPTLTLSPREIFILGCTWCGLFILAAAQYCLY
jgi:hypothetical protein